MHKSYILIHFALFRAHEPFAVLKVKHKLFYVNSKTKKVLYIYRRNLLLNCNYSQMDVPAG